MREEGVSPHAYAMTSTTAIAYTVRTRKTAVKRALDCISLSLPLRHQGPLPEIGQDFDIDYWTGSETVPALLRYDVSPCADGGYIVTSTRTYVPQVYVYRTALAGNGVEHSGPHDDLVEGSKALNAAQDEANQHQGNPLFKPGPFYLVIQEGPNKNHRRPISYHEQQIVNLLRKEA